MYKVVHVGRSFLFYVINEVQLTSFSAIVILKTYTPESSTDTCSEKVKMSQDF